MSNRTHMNNKLLECCIILLILAYVGNNEKLDFFYSKFKIAYFFNAIIFKYEKKTLLQITCSLKAH